MIIMDDDFDILKEIDAGLVTTNQRYQQHPKFCKISPITCNICHNNTIGMIYKINDFYCIFCDNIIKTKWIEYKDLVNYPNYKIIQSGKSHEHNRKYTENRIKRGLPANHKKKKQKDRFMPNYCPKCHSVTTNSIDLKDRVKCHVCDVNIQIKFINKEDNIEKIEGYRKIGDVLLNKPIIEVEDIDIIYITKKWHEIRGIKVVTK